VNSDFPSGEQLRRREAIVVRFMVSIEEVAKMGPVFLIVIGITWAAILALGFLLLGALRALGLQGWRLEQLEATTPSRVGRNGLKPGKNAPDFTLPEVTGGDVTLGDFYGRKVLLVFTQSGCGPCHRIMPELNRLQAAGEVQALVVNNGEAESTRQWAVTARARFPVAVQENYSVSRRYEVFATPFGFLIDERGIIASKGVMNNRQHIGYILEAALADQNGHTERGPSGAEGGESENVRSNLIAT
jgi:methylamine dehydrogenase accessory protein MauD